MTVNQCAAAGCGHVVPSAKLMCYHHWRRVPKGLQLRLYAAWNGGRPYPEYLEVRAAAIAVVDALQRQAAAGEP